MDELRKREHRSFRLTSEPIPPGSAIQAVLPAQVGAGLIWFLFWGLLLCTSGAQMAPWLPLNYLLFDIYLLARGAGRRGSFAGCSPVVREFLRASPVLMVPGAFFLGLAGSALR